MSLQSNFRQHTENLVKQVDGKRIFQTDAKMGMIF